jgi:hypothetical protein
MRVGEVWKWEWINYDVISSYHDRPWTIYLVLSIGVHYVKFVTLLSNNVGDKIGDVGSFGVDSGFSARSVKII